MTGLDKEISNGQLLITGEGQLDYQTKNGKAPLGAAQVANKNQIPVIGVAGSLGEGWDQLYHEGFDALFSIIDKPLDIDEAIAKTPELLEKFGLNLGKTLSIGGNLT